MPRRLDAVPPRAPGSDVSWPSCQVSPTEEQQEQLIALVRFPGAVADEPAAGGGEAPLKADLVVSVDSRSFTVANRGPAAAGPFTVTVGGFGSFRIAGLAVGQQVTREYTNRCAEGTREARADSLNEIDELDETNNVARAQIIC